MKLSERHKTFHDLHQSGCFVIPNPWDLGSAKMMAALGAKALATTSSGHAFTLGRADMGHVTRDEALQHAEDILLATNLPVSGDFENGFGDSADEVAETVRLSGEIGLSGISIEDTQMIEDNPAYDFDQAVDRIKAGVDAARALDRPFIFCARADGLMNGVYDLDEAIKRIQAFDKAGADLLYIPVLGGLDDLRRVCGSVARPVNALAVGALQKHSVEEMAAAGARRISLGSAIARKTHAVIRESVGEMLGAGRFDALADAAYGDDIDALLNTGES